MDEIYSRTLMLIGEKALEKLKNSHVIVFGVGGVGGYVVEALARSFVGEITVVDNDSVSKSNINRQIIATHSTVGRLKVDVIKERIFDINPQCKVNVSTAFFLPENSSQFDFSQYDYIVDAVDTVSAKLELAKIAQECKVPMISSMGTGNKLHPELLEISDIYKTSVCPLARAMRNLCKKNGIKKLKVVYSKEEPVKVEEAFENNKAIPASCAFVPSAAGLMIASVVINDLIK
ncbi:MAG: tRNA threonylcarbamoyladenosine dehydratase [Ruminococcaceae bacterium]|nr:tRNA threonylcarbamoyladenosine dehydratase [Oscillospiraceae bacterium]